MSLAQAATLPALPALPALPTASCGPAPDAVEGCLAAAAADCDRLAAVLLLGAPRHRAEAALAAARGAHADLAALQGELHEAFAPATRADIEAQGLRLLRAWPQGRNGDLSSYGAELALLIAERRPSRRALEQACRALKLSKVHLPAIAEVVAAIDAAEALLQSRARRFAALPEQIARAEAGLERERPARVAAEQAA